LLSIGFNIVSDPIFFRKWGTDATKKRWLAECRVLRCV
jgi:hypothetical protein